MSAEETEEDRSQLEHFEPRAGFRFIVTLHDSDRNKIDDSEFRPYIVTKVDVDHDEISIECVPAQNVKIGRVIASFLNPAYLVVTFLTKKGVAYDSIEFAIKDAELGWKVVGLNYANSDHVRLVVTLRNFSLVVSE
jgi:hypothetical protein